MDDDLARELRGLAWRAAVAFAAIAATLYPWLLPSLSPIVLPVFLAMLLAVVIGHWQRLRKLEPLVGVTIVAAANALGASQHGYSRLQDSVLGKGLPWLVAGLAIVAVALTISLLKMGLWTWLRRSVERLGLVTAADDKSA
jgi:hypothetical protein